MRTVTGLQPRDRNAARSEAKRTVTGPRPGWDRSPQQVMHQVGTAAPREAVVSG
jgi:hypothetical protein